MHKYLLRKYYMFVISIIRQVVSCGALAVYLNAPRRSPLHLTTKYLQRQLLQQVYVVRYMVQRYIVYRYMVQR